MAGFFTGLELDNLRYLFYAVTPANTTYPTIDDVPDYTKLTTGWMAILMITEMLIIGKKGAALNDTITSITSGIMYLLFKFSGKYLSAFLYASLYNRIHIIDLDPYSPWVWLLCFFTEDFGYYLAHRAMHECGLFWAFHQMHHSSEYYNLSTAMRKGVFLEVGTFGFDLIQALLIPPQIFLPHKYLNLLYQFWLHTELVPKLGPLEYVLNTPSSHRVHHGRNPYCIDRNYAGTLIIWDRLFGTYAEEREEEPISYGLVENVRSFNQLWLQWFEFGWFLFAKGEQKDAEGKPLFPSLLDRIKCIFAPPGWYPGLKTKQFFWWRYMENSTYGIPEVDYSVPRYNPPISTAKSLYLIGQMLFLASFVEPFYERRAEMDWYEFCSQLAIILGTVQMFGYYFDNDPLATFHDKIRCFGMLAYCYRYQSAALAMISLLSMPCIQYFENETNAAITEQKAKEAKELEKLEKSQRKSQKTVANSNGTELKKTQ